jgi:hypothetical protein
MPDDYIAFCEKKLWCAWKEHRLSVPPPFDAEAAPEPYLFFGVDGKQLVALTTNPGATMRHQRRAAVQAGVGPLREKDKYAKAAPKLGDFYETKLSGQARHRITKLRRLSSCLGYKGVMQVELIPFHSATLSQKSKLLGEIDKKGTLLGRYVELLGKFLRDRPVISIQAVSTKALLRRKTELSPWLRHVAKIAGLDLTDVHFVSLVEKGRKTTAAAWVSKREPRKALVLMMGANNLPGNKGLCKLAAALRESY